MKTIIRPDGSVYESQIDFKCPRCGSGDDANIKVSEVPQWSPLRKKEGVELLIDCRACGYIGSSDGKYIRR